MTRPLGGGRLEAYFPLPADLHGTVALSGRRYKWGAWGDQIVPDPQTKILATYADQFYTGAAAVTSRSLDRGGVTYCGVDGEQDLLDTLVQRSTARAGGAWTLLPPPTQLLQRAGVTIFLNYNDHAVTAPAGADAQFLLGSPNVGPADVAVWV